MITEQWIRDRKYNFPIVSQWLCSKSKIKELTPPNNPLELAWIQPKGPFWLFASEPVHACSSAPFSVKQAFSWYDRQTADNFVTPCTVLGFYYTPLTKHTKILRKWKIMEEGGVCKDTHTFTCFLWVLSDAWSQIDSLYILVWMVKVFVIPI